MNKLLTEKTTHKTKLVAWRGGVMEFASESQFDAICKPPWYVLKLTNTEVWADPWFYWVDYLGVPQIFLTQRRAEESAKGLRKQYHCKVEVVPLRP